VRNFAKCLVRVFGQAIGPVFGGLITQYLGYHAIFWVLFGAGAFALLALIIILPETLRSIAGNGSIRLKGINRPLYYKFTPPPEELVEHDLPPKQKLSFSMVFTPFRLLLEKDVFSIIFFGSVVYAVWSMVTSSTSALFQTRFHLNELELGLVFLPNGTASMLGAYLTGKLSKHDWVVMERRYRADKKIPDNVTLKKKELVDFPFEKTRMRNMWWMVLLFLISTALYGFSLLLDIIALPLILQFIISYTANSIFALNSTLVVDLYPGKSASATAVNNLVRCLLGALGVAVVQMIIDGVGAGPTFALFSGITLAATPLLLLEWRNGGRWAQDRRNRIATREKKAREENVEAVTVVQDVVAAKA
jgi:MFS family permease